MTEINITNVRIEKEYSLKSVVLTFAATGPAGEYQAEISMAMADTMEYAYGYVFTGDEKSALLKIFPNSSIDEPSGGHSGLKFTVEKSDIAVIEAIKELASVSNDDGRREELIDIVYAGVEPLCSTSTGTTTDKETHLWDWLYTGEWFVFSSPAEIAKGWDELTQECDELTSN